jgi:bacterioferritin-associated ferredoxin
MIDTCEWFALSIYAITMIVCICNRITESEVRRAARCGARTPEEAYACEGCEIQCGCCLDYAQQVIDEERGKPAHLRLVTSRAA